MTHTIKGWEERTNITQMGSWVEFLGWIDESIWAKMDCAGDKTDFERCH